jgi:putative ABC transport system permease protein
LKQKDLLKLVYTNLLRAKVRTILTTSGVAIGTVAIVCMVSLGFGLQNSLSKQILNMGSITDIDVSPKYDFSQMQNPDESPKFEKPLDDDSIKEIEKIDGVTAAVPVINIYNATLVYSRYRLNVSINGIDALRGKKLGGKLAEGRYLNPGDRQSIVLGYKLPASFSAKKKTSSGLHIGAQKKNSAENKSDEGIPQGLFGAMPKSSKRVETLNKTILIELKRVNKEGKEEVKRTQFRVVGVMDESGGQEDMSAIIPLKTAKQFIEWSDIGAKTEKTGYEAVKVRVQSPDKVDMVSREIERMGFTQFSMKQMLAAVGNVSKIIQLLLGGVGCIVLFVSSFGIMNTMIMSIYERTKEIGIMKVIGASINDIRRIFVFEAAGIGFLGGVIGVFISWVLVLLANKIVNLFFAKGTDGFTVADLPLGFALFAVCFSTVIGLAAGLYPAQKAAKLSPLTAMRHE